VVSGVHLAVVRADRDVRLRNAFLVAVLVLWLLYTRFLATAQALHLTLPPCPFLIVTGHPCPFCGGTRSFAYVWRGDLDRALALYPLGPLMFAGTVVAIPALLAAAVLGRDLAWRLSVPWRRTFLAALCLPLLVSWILKLTVLPN
jgi:hypothetical protein